MARAETLIPLLCLLLALSILTGCRNGEGNNGPTETAGIAQTSTAEFPTSTSSPQPASPTAVPPTEPGPAATPTETEELTLKVYFIRDEHLAVGHRTIPHTLAVGTAAMQALLAGPSDYEAGLGFTSAIPEGTELLGLEIQNGVASVDLNSQYESGGGSFSVSARLAQVIYTLTQFPTVDAVEFRLDGEPVEVFSGEGVIIDGPAGRDFEHLLPAIFVETIAVGDSISSPVTVAGTANTFEATFMARIVTEQGETLAEEVVTATSGTGTRGTFETTISFEVESETAGKLVVFEYSARDGSQINVIEIPVTLEP